MKQNIINSTIKTAARSAGNIVRSAFNKNNLKERNKSISFCDVFSRADMESENIIIKIISDKLPAFNILSEETGFINRNSKDTIVIDPLDGSSNFLLGIPHFSVAISHFHLGKINASVVYNPILDKMYFAEKGKGVFINGKKLKPQTKIERNSKYVAVNFNKAIWHEKRKVFDKLYKSKITRVLNNWSPNLDYCLLAENKIDAVLAIDSLIYDFAPGLLIAIESGCVEFPKVKNVDLGINSSMSFVVARKPALVKKIKNIV
jgi:myo-inositol-1(or 4)-monophosphatase